MKKINTLIVLFILLFLTGCELFKDHPLDGLLNVEANIYVEVNTLNDNYSQFITGYTVNKDLIESFSVTGEVNPNLLGDYPVVIEVTSTNGDSYSFESTIHIVDTTKPNIVLNSTYFGEGDLTELIKSTLTLTDNYDLEENLQTDIVFNDVVDGNGIYNIDISITDTSNNTHTINTNIIVDYNYDNVSPIIIGVKNIYINCFEEIDFLDNISVSDIQNDNNSITVEANVDNETVGFYPITYIATDSAGNTSTVEAFVYVSNGINEINIPQPYLLDLTATEIETLNNMVNFINGINYAGSYNISTTFLNEFYTSSLLSKALNRELRLDEIQMILKYQELMEQNEIVYMENILNRELTDTEKVQVSLVRNTLYECVDNGLIRDLYLSLNNVEYSDEFSRIYLELNLKTILTTNNLLFYIPNPTEELYNAIEFYKQFYIYSAYSKYTLLFNVYPDLSLTEINEMKLNNELTKDILGFEFDLNMSYYAFDDFGTFDDLLFVSIEEIETIINRSLTQNEIDYFNYIKWINAYRRIDETLNIYDYQYIKSLDFDKLVLVQNLLTEYLLNFNLDPKTPRNYHLINIDYFESLIERDLNQEEIEALNYWNNFALENDELYITEYQNELSHIMDETTYNYMSTYYKISLEKYYTIFKNITPLYINPNNDDNVIIIYYEYYIGRELTQTEIDAVLFVNNNPIYNDFIDSPYLHTIQNPYYVLSVINKFGLERSNEIFEFPYKYNLDSLMGYSLEEIQTQLQVTFTQEEKELFYDYKSTLLLKSIMFDTEISDIVVLEGLLDHLDYISRNCFMGSIQALLNVNMNYDTFKQIETEYEVTFTDEFIYGYLELFFSNSNDITSSALDFYKTSYNKVNIFIDTQFTVADALLIDKYLYNLGYTEIGILTITELINNYSIDEIEELYDIEISIELENAITRMKTTILYYNLYNEIYDDLNFYLETYSNTTVYALNNQIIYIQEAAQIINDYNAYTVFTYFDKTDALDYLSTLGLNTEELDRISNFLDDTKRISNRQFVLDTIRYISMETTNESLFTYQDIINIKSIQHDFDQQIIIVPFISINYPSTLEDEDIKLSINKINNYYQEEYIYQILTQISLELTVENYNIMTYLINNDILFYDYDTSLNTTVMNTYINYAELNPDAYSLLHTYFTKAVIYRLELNLDIDLSTISLEQLTYAYIAKDWYEENHLLFSYNKIYIESLLSRDLSEEEEKVVDAVIAIRLLN